MISILGFGTRSHPNSGFFEYWSSLFQKKKKIRFILFNFFQLMEICIFLCFSLFFFFSFFFFVILGNWAVDLREWVVDRLAVLDLDIEFVVLFWSLLLIPSSRFRFLRAFRIFLLSVFASFCSLFWGRAARLSESGRRQIFRIEHISKHMSSWGSILARKDFLEYWRTQGSG